ncbi:MAG: sensor histidine kinase [Anaerolineales bacterium]|nr:sensor histidine kinase [Anaerolineales bacterium]
MKRIHTFAARLQSLWGPHSEWPFMLFLTFVFIFIYVWTVISSSRLCDPVVLTAFTVLFIAHLFLHWISIWWLKKNWSVWAYIAIQAAIVFTLVSFAGELGALVGLYLGLIGEAAGMFTGAWWKNVIIILCILALSVVSFFWVLPQGDIFWWTLAILPMTAFVIIYVVLYSRQADARIKAQELLVELEAANRRLTEYADEIEDLTLANERQRMARELHDTLAQGLAGLILQLEAADSHLGGGRAARAQGIVQQAMTRARATLAEARRAIDGLRADPPGGLEEAVRTEIGHFTSASGLPCALEFSITGKIPEETAELVLRTVSEGLTNIARHAQARRASVCLRGGADSLSLEVVDDGIGFNAAAEEDRAGHYGLIGLRERVRIAGGTLQILSAEGQGTSIAIRIPIPGE